jgi:antirestriction protein ArdC
MSNKETKMDQKFEKIDPLKRFAEFVENALAGDVPAWVQPWSNIDSAYRNYGTKRAYKGIHNQLTIAFMSMAHGWNDPRFLTFQQARAQGGTVRKGEKGVPVLFWKFFKKVDENGKEKSFPIAKCFTLFNVAQIDGMEVKPLPEKPEQTFTPASIVADMLAKLEISVTHAGNRACYHPGENRLSMPEIAQFKSAEHYHATVAHELIHAVIARVEGKECVNYGTDVSARAEEELVAELGSFMLCKTLGLDGHMDDQHLAYVKSWSEKIAKDHKWIYNICKRANARSQFILAAIGQDGKEEEEGEDA